MARYKVRWCLQGYHDMDGEWTPCYGHYSALHYKNPYSYSLNITPNDKGYYLLIYLCLTWSKSENIKIYVGQFRTLKECKIAADDIVYSQQDFTNQIESFKKTGNAMFDENLNYVGVCYRPPHYYQDKKEYNKYTFWDKEIYPYKQYSTIYILRRYACDSKPYIDKIVYGSWGHSGQTVDDPQLLQIFLDKLDKEKFAKYFD